jgi:hypothetical protein
MEAKKLWGDDAIYDIYYDDLMQDPIAEMKKLYAFLGDEFTSGIENAMCQWIDSHPQNQFGKHNYSLAEFGQSKESLASIFGDYIKHYGFAD